MNLSQLKDYYNKKPVEFVIRENYELVEDKEYVSRFTLKNVKDIANIPINEPIKYSDQTIIKAIKYGMIFLINYKGEEDNHFAGHERAIYPMVLGRSSKGKILLRGWHLNGWSVSQKRHTEKIWRLFRADRILSMTFTGSFYRLPPAGYNMNDKGMRGGIIAKADFNVIRKNQQNLVKQNVLQSREEISLGTEERKRRGKLAREWVTSDESMMTAENMSKNIIKHIDKVLENWKPKPKFELIKTEPLKRKHIRHKLVY
jgi:hypothetical protein